MRERTLIAAALLMGISVAACSKPGSGNSRKHDPAPAANQANLVSIPESGVPVVSGLEAGHDPRLALPRPGGGRAAEFRVARRTGEKATDAGAEHHHAALAATAPLPEMRMTSTAMALTPLLAPAALPLAPVPGGPEAVASGNDPDPRPVGGGRGPTIIIRGGMGGPDDDCDLLHHRRGFGAAINRMAPPIGGRSGGFGGSSRFH